MAKRKVGALDVYTHDQYVRHIINEANDLASAARKRLEIQDGYQVNEDVRAEVLKRTLKIMLECSISIDSFLKKLS